MPKNSKFREARALYTQNRELSWLHFNRRVLEEADDVTNPPMERFKFISIFTSNLDEFFMVRVGSLFDLNQICPSEMDQRSGLTPLEQLDQIYAAVPPLIDYKRQIYQKVREDLAASGIEDLTFSQLDRAEQKYVKKYFKANILPILSPIIIGSHHPVPHFNNKGQYIAVLLKSGQRSKSSIGLIPIPEVLPPYLRLPGEETVRYIRTENIIRNWAGVLFDSYAILESCILSVTRNADLSFDDDKFEDLAYDFRTRVSSLLKHRDHLSAVRLELSNPISQVFSARLAKITHIQQRQIFVDHCPLNMKYVFRLADDLPEALRSRLLYLPYTPRWPEDLDPNHGMIEQIQQKDKLLFFPFDSTEPFLKLLAEAAERPDVLSIKITIYRLAASSKIARLLCRAAENGKQVLVMMELRARFDEANNITWSKLLENAGCQILYGIEDYKCHSKICLVTLRNHGRLHYITQIGTGNYNETTSTMYTDLSFLTASKEIGEDATTFFQNLLIDKLDGQYQHLLVSPHGIERELLRMIDEQIQLREEGYICMKINSLTDCEIIDRLVCASQAGVEVQLIIRGICCILPEVPHYTEQIHVTSIVGRFLEHARIYCFGRNEHRIFYISSADLMGRNLHHRVEIACPIYDPEIQSQLTWILTAQLEDTAKACCVNATGDYTRKSPVGHVTNNYQQRFMEGTLHKLQPDTPPRLSPSKQFTRALKRLIAWHPGISGMR